MSLASTMIRLSRGKPDRRYALDPLHEQAIRNYLAMQSRGLQIPSLLDNSRSALHTHLGAHLPLFFSALQSFLSDHDQGSLAAALDLHTDHSSTPVPQNSFPFGESPHVELIQALRNLMANSEQPQIVRGYRPGQIDSADTRRRFLQAFSGRQFAHNLGLSTQHAEDLGERGHSPLLQAAQKLRESVVGLGQSEYHPIGGVRVYDALSGLEDAYHGHEQRHNFIHRPRQARNQLAEILNQLIPRDQ